MNKSTTGSKKSNSGRQQVEKPNSFKQIIHLFQSDTTQFIFGLAMTVTAIYLIVAYISFFFYGGADQSVLESAGEEFQNATGSVGAVVADRLVNKMFGLPVILLLLFLLAAGCRLMKIVKRLNLIKCFISSVFLTVWFSVALHLTLFKIMGNGFISPGGRHGEVMTEKLNSVIGLPGTLLLLLLTLIIFCIYISRRTIDYIRSSVEGVKGTVQKESQLRKEKEETLSYNRDEKSIGTVTAPSMPYDVHSTAHSASSEEFPGADTGTEPDAVTDRTTDTVTDTDYLPEKEEDEDLQEKDTIKVTPVKLQSGDDIELEITQTAEEEKAEGSIQKPYDPRLDLSHYKFPGLDLLSQPKTDPLASVIDEDEQRVNKSKIITTLNNFGIEITSIRATVGPTITLYEITLPPGIRISKIRNLEDDIALNIAAEGIRIIAPIPGKGTIGIEVPNSKARRQIVSIYSVIGSKKFAETKMELPVCLGKTITNEVFMFDLAKTPHLLVAGATGQGKSVGLNTIITSLLYKKHPAELKLVMVDPKMVEFSIYSPIIRHFLAKLPDEKEAIITDTTKVIHTLKSLCIEMDARYELLKEAGVRAVLEYNDLFKARKLRPDKGHRYMPYIVVIIDEFGDLIMTAGKDIEMPIARIAQKARAVGIHMVIATQRPTTNIITGTIKANFPARMAFRVMQMIDSRTILDRPGANQLIGYGDLLYYQGNEPVRVQCAFVDTPEVTRICDYISRQQGYTDAYELPEYVEEGDSSASAEGLGPNEKDPLFEEAARLIVSVQQGSTSLLQRKFSIGYNRAGRLMDQLERAGIVGAADGSKTRQVLCFDEMDLQNIINQLRQ